MQDSHTVENDFLNKITKIIEANISNEQFGVSELANEIGMSRSNLLRKVKSLAKVSVSQFIRQIRLKHALDLLKQNAYTVSEVSYKVGFGSTSYFIKCFHDHYGYPPGEVGKKDFSKNDPVLEKKPQKKLKLKLPVIVLFLIILALLVYLFYPEVKKEEELEKSIAVLPFINDSNDSTNVYIINGLMESVLNNLQKIEDLRVVSRTSVEKYRNSPKLIPEMAKELNVNYFVEGSGQKVGDQILLNIQLIDANTDRHLWAEQFQREAKDIFQLQTEVAKSIADKVEAIITPEEEELINKPLTDNLLAYDYYLKGLDQMHEQTVEGLVNAIPFMEKAIELDNEFASAYAAIAICYYYIDIFQIEKKYSEEINNYADKALLYDSDLALSLIAKALFYLQGFEYELAVSYLEKALKYNPNSAFVINLLSDFYANHIPDTEKYLEYALKGIRLNIAANDSVTTSYIYLHVSNAFIQTGFVEEAENYINKSLAYNPDNLFSQYVKAYVLYAKNGDLNETKNLISKALEQDTTRIDIMQELASICCYLRDYETSYYYYKKFTDIRETQGMNIFRHKDGQIGFIMEKMGFTDEAEKYFDRYKEFAENDQSIYRNLNLAVYFFYKGETDKAIEYLSQFSEEENFHYWIILFFYDEPFMENLKNNAEIKKIFHKLENKFWKKHKQIRSSLEKENLI